VGNCSFVIGKTNIDLFNPNSSTSSILGHVFVDGLWGHLVQFVGGNIDPKVCPFQWTKVILRMSLNYSVSIKAPCSRGAFCWVFAALLFFGASSTMQGQPLPLAQQPAKATNDGSLKPGRSGTKWGYVDPRGRFTIPPRFDSADPFSEGVAAVKLDGRFGYIDTEGRFVIQPKYFRAGPFKGGFAWVVTRKPWAPLGTGEYGFALYGQVTYLDRSGRELHRPFSAEEVSNFSEGLAAVRPGKIFGGCSEQIGYLNTKGEWSIRPQFDEAHDFSEGLAAVNKGGRCHLGGKWGYIDKDGTLVIPFQYDFAGQFKDGQACVEEAGQWKLIHVNGKDMPDDKHECLR
jgi:WG repeat protein